MPKVFSRIPSQLTRLFDDYGAYSFGVLMAAGITVSTLPDTLLLNWRRSMFAYVSDDDEEKAIDPELQARIDKILFKILLKPEEEANLEFFLSSAADPVHFGSLKMRSGAIIGLPASMQYKDNHSFKKENFLFLGIPLNVDGREDASDGEESSLTTLKASLLMAPPLKDFIIARQINYSACHHLHFLVTVKTLFAFATYTIYHFLDLKLKPVLAHLKWVKRGCLFTLLPFITLPFYLSVKDAYNCWLDYSVDKHTASLGREFAQGGVDYYNSVLSRNQALRNLSPSGSSRFTPFGNITSTIRSKNLQLTTRRDNLLKLLKEYDQQGIEKLESKK